MFRIHINRGNEATSLTIEGKLTGPWVRELEKCWRAELSAEPQKPIEVHLAAVSFIDLEGRELLTRMRRERATLVARGCLMKSLVEGIETRLSRERSAGDAA